MLNRRTQIQSDEPSPAPDHPPIDLFGKTQWRCPRGHVTETWLRFNGTASFGGSAWDFCDRCREHPNPLQDTQMHLRIFSKWLDDLAITIEQCRALTHSILSQTYTPHLAAEPTGFLNLPTWGRAGSPGLLASGIS